MEETLNHIKESVLEKIKNSKSVDEIEQVRKEAERKNNSHGRKRDPRKGES